MDGSVKSSQIKLATKFYMLCETKFVSKEEFFLTDVWVTWKVDGGLLFTRFNNMWLNSHKLADKIRIVERYSSFRNTHVLETAQRTPPTWFTCLLTFLYESDTKPLDWKWLNQCTFFPLCVFHVLFSMYNSKPNYGYRDVKNSVWNFQAMRQGNLLSY